MVKEEERHQEEHETNFKERLFIQDPSRYADVYERPSAEDLWDPNFKGEMISPVNEEEMEAALADMRRMGLIDN